jgi:hypothetical protein
MSRACQLPSRTKSAPKDVWSSVVTSATSSRKKASRAAALGYVDIDTEAADVLRQLRCRQVSGRRQRRAQAEVLPQRPGRDVVVEAATLRRGVGEDRHGEAAAWPTVPPLCVTICTLSICSSIQPTPTS